MGKSAFDALHAALDSLICGWGNEDVDVFGHDDEGVELIAALIAVVKEGLEQQVGVCGSGEDRTTAIGDGGGRVGVRHGGRSIPQGLKPRNLTKDVMPGMNPRPTARKAWGLWVRAFVVPTHPAKNAVWMGHAGWALAQPSRAIQDRGFSP